MKTALIALALCGVVACDAGEPVEVTAAPIRHDGAHKVLVCHHAGPHGKVVIISVDESALPAHLRLHGDDWAANSDGSCDRDTCGQGEKTCSQEGYVTICCPDAQGCGGIQNGILVCGD